MLWEVYGVIVCFIVGFENLGWEIYELVDVINNNYWVYLVKWVLFIWDCRSCKFKVDSSKW